VSLRIACLCAFAALACADFRERAQAPLEPFEVRSAVDRVEAYVGDSIGVSIELDLPDGYVASLPRPDASAEFETEALEPVTPFRVEGGVRYAFKWRLRARSPGVQAIPSLRVPVRLEAPAPTGGSSASPLSPAAGSDGRAGDAYADLRTASLPLNVRSVRAELAARDVLFDIRAAPRGSNEVTYAMLAGILVAFGWAGWAMLRSRPSVNSAQLERLREEILARLESAPDDITSERLRDLRGMLRRFVQLRFGLQGASWTPAELSLGVDARTRALIAELEQVCFAPTKDGARTRDLLVAWSVMLRAGTATDVSSVPSGGLDG